LTIVLIGGVKFKPNHHTASGTHTFSLLQNGALRRIGILTFASLSEQKERLKPLFCSSENVF